VPYGFNTSVFKFNPENTRPENSFITIGNLKDPYCYFRKGYDLVFELAERNPNWHFTIVGWNTTDMAVPSNITLIQFSPVEVLIEELQNHRYYLQLSVMEGFPNALGEAMACGCVPIGSNVSGIPELIGDTGIILKKKNILDLEQNIQLLLTQNFQNASLKSRDRIKLKFLPKHRSALLVNVFQQYGC
jgi:glycosyltransferase involved in cell wall biosynthesis